MKLSEDTIEFLKNYTGINQSLQFKKGSEIATITPTKTIYALATVVEDFPLDFAIYDLNKILSKISLYKDCEIEFEKDRLVFKAGRRKDYIKYSSSKVVTAPPDKKLTIKSPEHEFTITLEDLVWQRKSAGISGSPYMVFRGDGEKIYLESTDLKDDSSDISSTEIGDTKKEFSYVIKVENWKMLDGSYNVKLAKGISGFQHTEKSIEYFVAIEAALSKY